MDVQVVVVLEVSALKGHVGNVGSLLALGLESVLLDGGVDVREGVLAGDDISSSLLGAMTSKCLCQLLKGNVTLGGGRLGLGSSGSSIGSQKE